MPLLWAAALVAIAWAVASAVIAWEEAVAVCSEEAEVMAAMVNLVMEVVEWEWEVWVAGEQADLVEAAWLFLSWEVWLVDYCLVSRFSPVSVLLLMPAR